MQLKYPPPPPSSAGVKGVGAHRDLSNRVATQLLLSLQNSFALQGNAYIRKVCFFAPQAHSINEHNSGSLQLSPSVRHTHTQSLLLTHTHTRTHTQRASLKWVLY